MIYLFLCLIHLFFCHLQKLLCLFLLLVINLMQESIILLKLDVPSRGSIYHVYSEPLFSLIFSSEKILCSGNLVFRISTIFFSDSISAFVTTLAASKRPSLYSALIFFLLLLRLLWQFLTY